MKRALLYGAIAILAIRLLWMYVIPGWSEITTDFQNYYTAAWAVRHGEPLMDLYDPLWFESTKNRAGIHGQPALFNYYTPFSALVMWPLAALTPLAAKHVWIVVNLVALALVVVFVARELSMPLSHVTLIALLGGDALGNNFAFGQFYILLTLFMVVAVCFRNRVPWLAGISTGAATVTKAFPGFLIPYFAITRRWRALAWSVAGIAILSIFGLWLMGWAPHRVFLEEVLPRLARGEVQDPYNVRFNTLQALLRRALIPEPGLNPHPIVEAPTIFFFLRTFISLAVALITLLALKQNSCVTHRVGPMFELGALVLAISLITPSQASYHQILLLPGIVAAVHWSKTIWGKALIAGTFALICSNVMGAGARWTSGVAMLLAFPRAYLVLALWVLFLLALGVKSVARRPLAVGLGLIMIVAGISASRELARWETDVKDGASMVKPDPNTFIEIFPSVGDKGLVYSTLKPEGYSILHPSARGKGLVHELNGTVFGWLADGSAFGWSGASEPSLGPNSVVGVRHDGSESVVVERGAADGAWRELFRRPGIVHDPTPSPDETRVAFSEWVNGHYQLAEWDRSTKAVRVVVSGTGDYRYPSYSPTARWLFFAQNIDGQWDVVRLWRSEGRYEVLTTSEANDFMPAVSPDEKTLYFASDRRRGYRFSAIFKISLKD